ncbi:hypothetical protein V1522DRAFT_425601 [Lipomyces starkeyi]
MRHLDNSRSKLALLVIRPPYTILPALAVGSSDTSLEFGGPAAYNSSSNDRGNNGHNGHDSDNLLNSTITEKLHNAFAHCPARDMMQKHGRRKCAWTVGDSDIPSVTSRSKMAISYLIDDPDTSYPTFAVPTPKT